MQTRRLRLGDVVDDYCPRERRLSNHVIAAMVDDTIKQTRCSTCDFEHPYKEGKVPARRKKKDGTSALFQEVLDNVTEGMKPPATAASAAAPAAPAPSAPAAAAPVEPAVPALPVAPPAAATDVTPDVPVAAPRRRASSKRAGVSAPLFTTESAAPAAAPVSVAAAPAATTVTASAATVSAGGQKAAAPAAATPASAPPVSATLVKTPAAPAPAAKAAAPAQTPPAPAAPVTAPRGVLRPRETPAGDAANQPPAMAASPVTPEGGEPQPDHEEDAPLHRRALIRATLPRPVGEVPVRAIPTFTIREAAAARPNKFRHKGRPNGMRQGGRQPIGPMSMGNEARPGNTRGPQGRGGAPKKAGGHQPHRPGGHQSSRGPKGQGGGGKRFK